MVQGEIGHTGKEWTVGSYRILNFSLKPEMNVCGLLSKNDSSFFGLLFFTFRMRIVDDDVSWTSISTTKAEKEEEEDDGDLPMVCIFFFFFNV